MVNRGKKSEFRLGHWVDVYRGSGAKTVKDVNHHKLPMYGKGKNQSKEDVERLLKRMVELEVLKQRSKTCTVGGGFTVSCNQSYHCSKES